LIKVKAITAQYATSRKGVVGSAIEFAKGVATGEPPAVNKLRYLSEEEIQQCKLRRANQVIINQLNSHLTDNDGIGRSTESAK
jgi:hypothetical protein